MPRALVTGHPYGDEIESILRSKGIQVVRGNPLTQGRIEPVYTGSPSGLSTVEVIVVTHMDSCTGDVIAASPMLKGIVSAVIGLDTVDMQAAEARELIVAHGAMEENYLGVSEATVMLIGALLLDLSGKQRMLANDSSEPGMRGRMVRGKTIGLVGLGRAALGVFERLQGWAVEVIAHDPFVSAPPSGIRMVGLSELLASSDVVSLHVTLNEATRGMIGADELSLMMSDAFLINTARGPVVDEDALLAALEAGSIAGAALDVFAHEPLSLDHPLRRLDNVILTPHAIGHSKELWEAIPRVAAEQVVDILEDRRPRFVANMLAQAGWQDDQTRT